MPEFTNIADATVDDLEGIAQYQAAMSKKMGEHLFAHLDLLRGDYGGFPIDRYEHCVQTGSRALRDGRDDEYVVCCLFHDIGDILAPYDHDKVIAEILRPFISDENYFVFGNHATFQGYNFWGKIGLDKNARDEFRDSPYFDAAVEFVEKYDSPSFDKDYENVPIEDFHPIVERVLAKPKGPNRFEKIFEAGAAAES